MKTMDEVMEALCCIRAPVEKGEYDIHSMIAEALTEKGIEFAHEVRLAPKCRIDFTAGTTGIEVKRGKVDGKKLTEQLTRYLACPEISGIIVVTERRAAVPGTLLGKKIQVVCLMKLWGIAI